MEMNEFLKEFANQFDDTDLSDFKSDTNFKDLDEWSSLNELAVLNMIGKKFGVKLSPAELNKSETIQALFDLVLSKK